MSRDFANLGRALHAARARFPATEEHHGGAAFEGGQLPGAIMAANRIRTARQALNDLPSDTLPEVLADTLVARFGKTKASLILRDALAGVEK